MTHAPATYQTAIPLLVVGPDTAHDKRWKDSCRSIPGIAVVRSDAQADPARIINDRIHSGTDELLLVADSAVWIGHELRASVLSLVSELNETYSSWGICGNAGVRSDAGRVYNFVRRPPHNPEHSVSPKPVITLGGCLWLLNAGRLRSRGVQLPEGIGMQSVGLALSLASLEAGLLALADRRLMAAHFPSQRWNLEMLHRDTIFCRHLGGKLLNHFVPTDVGPLSIARHVSFETLALPRLSNAPESGSRADLLAWFDAALLGARRTAPRIEVAVRSQFRRMSLLERTVASCAAAALEGGGMCSLRLRIMSDRSELRTRGLERHFASIAPALDQSIQWVNVRPPRQSRVDLMLQAIESSTADYILFVDDDDFVFPGCFPVLGRVLSAHIPVLAVGSTRTYEEVWCDTTSSERFFSDQAPRALKNFCPEHRIGAQGVLRSFSGENYIPICGLVMPREVLARQLVESRAHGDYLEDYFMLLRLLSSSRLELELFDCEFAGISHRGAENTVKEKDRSRWNESYATFFQELLSTDGNTNPLLWQFGRAVG